MSGRYVVQTFGCQMNVHDSDRMEETLRAHGWSPSDDVESADLVVFNTCSVRERAEQKLRSEAGKLAQLKARRPDLCVAVAGCVAQREGEKILARMPYVDIVIGPDNIAELPALVLDHASGGVRVARTVFDLDAPWFLAAEPRRGEAPVSAFVTTMKGCDERCSFCIVPTTRGPERYRPSSEIVAEVARWVAAGAREVTLLGQTVNSFPDPELPPPASDDPDDFLSFYEPLRVTFRGSSASGTRAPTRGTPRRRSSRLTAISGCSRATCTCPSSRARTACSGA